MMDVDLSLDDIIRNNKGTNSGGSIAPSKKFGSRKPQQQWRKTAKTTVFKEGQRIIDARNRIVEKKRAKIRDARDKIIENSHPNVFDARHRLLHKKKLPLNAIKKGNNNFLNGRTISLVGSLQRRVPSTSPLKPKAKLFRQPPEVISVPRGYIDYDNMDRMEEEEYAAASRLSRTVKNDFDDFDLYKPARMEIKRPSSPRRRSTWAAPAEPYDPFDVYEVPAHDRHRSPDYPGAPPPKGILRPSSRQKSPELYQRRYIPESNSHLSYEMRSRLEHAPDPHASMGIFSNPLKSQHPQPVSPSGYRIVVSNLHTNVTPDDIKELFGDIGELTESRIVRPGVAEVIYKTLDSAERAVDTYHNRQLDGLPMKCLLVNPRASDKPTAPAIKTSSSNSRHNAGKTPLEIDIDALHKVLFRRH